MHQAVGEGVRQEAQDRLRRLAVSQPLPGLFQGMVAQACGMLADCTDGRYRIQPRNCSWKCTTWISIMASASVAAARRVRMFSSTTL